MGNPKPNPNPKLNPNPNLGKLWDELVHWDEEGYVMSCSTPGEDVFTETGGSCTCEGGRGGVKEERKEGGRHGCSEARKRGRREGAKEG